METSTSSVLHAGSFVGRQAGRQGQGECVSSCALPRRKRASRRKTFGRHFGQGKRGKEGEGQSLLALPYPVRDLSTCHPPTHSPPPPHTPVRMDPSLPPLLPLLPEISPFSLLLLRRQPASQTSSYPHPHPPPDHSSGQIAPPRSAAGPPHGHHSRAREQDFLSSEDGDDDVFLVHSPPSSAGNHHVLPCSPLLLSPPPLVFFFPEDRSG